MHISEGVLSPEMVITGWIGAIPILVFSLKTIKSHQLPRIALFSSLFFVISFIHVPLGPTSAHLSLNGLLGLFLGLGVFPALFIALLFQALFFQYGGITVLGLNTLIMGIPPYLSYLFFARRLNSSRRAVTLISAFATGSFSFLGSVILLSLITYLSNPKFYLFSGVLIITQLPMALVEGLITAFTVMFLKQTYPEALNLARDPS